MGDDDYCINGCGRVALHERPYGVTVDGLEITERVCCRCAVEDTCHEG